MNKAREGTGGNYELVVAGNTSATDSAPNLFTSEQIAARRQQVEDFLCTVQKANTSSGRNGKPWREWIHEGHDD